MNSPNLSRTSPLGGRIFDPFLIKEGYHEKHSDSTSIVRIEQSGRIFCPICLENTPVEELDEIDANTLNYYVRNLFDAIDQYSETERLRKIILPILVIVMKKRGHQVANDYEYHKIIRVLYKVMKSSSFNRKEFFMITVIFSIITGEYNSLRPLPLNTVWKATQHMMNHGKSLLVSPQSASDDGIGTVEILGALAAVIRSYLGALGRFSMDRISDIMFQIYSDNSSHEQYRRCHRDSQLECINIISKHILPAFEAHLKRKTRYKRQGRAAIGDIFEAIRECLRSSSQLGSRNLFGHLLSADILLLARNVVRSNKDCALRAKIKSFIKYFVASKIERDLGADETLAKVTSAGSIIQIRHRSVIKSCKRKVNQEGVLFYIILNYVAQEIQSKYYEEPKVKQILAAMDPVDIEVHKSEIFLKAYNYLLAITIRSIHELPQVESSLQSILESLNSLPDGRKIFNEAYCFNEKVFYLVFTHPKFIEQVGADTLTRLFEKDQRVDKLRQKLNLLFRNTSYNDLVIEYLITSAESSSILARALTLESQSEDDYQDTFEDNVNDNLVSELGAFLSALLHESIYETSNYIDELPNNPRLLRVTDIITCLMHQCSDFTFPLNTQFIIDLFSLMEVLYERHITNDQRSEIDETLVFLNEFVIQLITGRCDCLMTLLKYMDFAILGYMYDCLKKYSKGDKLVESIAKLLVAYDNISYPIAYQIAHNLCPMKDSVFNWMLSESRDLHHLSLITLHRVLPDDCTSNSTKLILTTGFIHMIFGNDEILQSELYLNMTKSMMKHEQLLYHPLMDVILPTIPESIRHELNIRKNVGKDQTPLFNCSFESSETDIEDSDELDVDKLFDDLQDEERMPQFGDTYNIPSHSFASAGIRTNTSRCPDIDDWERCAYDTNSANQNAHTQ